MSTGVGKTTVKITARESGENGTSKTSCGA